MKPLRILLVLPSPPLPFGSADGRWYYILLKELTARKHHITAFVACKSEAEIYSIKNTFSEAEHDIRCHLYHQTSGVRGKLQTLRQPYAYIFSSELRKDLADELAKPFDVLHLEQIWSGYLGRGYENKTLLNIHYLFSVDRTFQSPNTLQNRLRRFLSYGAEKRLLKSFNTISTLTTRLTASVQQQNTKAKVYTTPMGLDLSLYPFHYNKPPTQTLTVGLIGSFNWLPSYSAAERLITHLWPSIKAALPNARLQIVGRSAKDALKAFIDTPGLELHQDVPNIFPYFQNMNVLLYAPEAGSGMKVKVMEAFALGTPVVTTEEGIEGLSAKDGIHASIANSDKSLIEKTVLLLKNSERQKMYSVNARQLMEKHFSPEVTVSCVEENYMKA